MLNSKYDWVIPTLQIILFPIVIIGGLVQLSYWKIKHSMNPKGSYYNLEGKLIIPRKTRGE